MATAARAGLGVKGKSGNVLQIGEWHGVLSNFSDQVIEQSQKRPDDAGAKAGRRLTSFRICTIR